MSEIEASVAEDAEPRRLRSVPSPFEDVARSFPPAPSLRQGAAALTMGGLVGKLSGVVRELYLAAAFGTSPVVAAFRVAQTATLIPANLAANDSLSSGFLPLHARMRRSAPAEADTFYYTLQRALFAITSCIAVAMFFLAPWVTALLAPGLDHQVRQTTAQMIRVMALGIPLFVSGSMNSYLALSFGRFRPTSLRSSIQNLGLLGGVAVAAVTRNGIFLAWGFTGGCVIYCIFAFVYARKQRLPEAKPAWLGWRESGRVLRPFFMLMRGLLLIPLVVQVNEAFERVVASFLGPQTVAATEFANFVADTFVTLIAVPLALAGMASIGGEVEPLVEARRRANSLTPALLLVGLPISVLLSLRARGAVDVLYERGHFDAASAAATATVLTGFALGLWAQLLGYVYAKLYSATFQVRRLVRTTCCGVAAGMATMALAIPTRQPVFIGLGGTVCGIVVTAVAAVQMGVVRDLVGWVCRLAPACALVVLLSRFFPGRSMWSLAEFGVSALAVWAVYICMVPTVRLQVRKMLRREIAAVRTLPGVSKVTPSND
ncbi:MAG TPA: lipid II flippase MurJ [Acidothermaceae bacterium]|jgi:peptidoglycan biosynthesis protein MviN/MurJ (putative lipid II flippase)|nr:lipid II flippase MurJ [Acidothermaceae bacterium]